MRNITRVIKNSAFYVSLFCVLSIPLSGHSREVGITESTIRIGGVMDFEGQSKGLGLNMKKGILAAIQGKQSHGKRIEFITQNDSYSPSLTIKATEKLIDDGIFIMLGNVGTPTAKVSLPLLAESNIPAVGFFTGAGILRPGVGDVVNFRASYIQETAAVINSALESGVDPREICAYVQNDGYGMSGVEGIKKAIANKRGARKITKLLDQLLSMNGENPLRNNIGPVGVYQRNTLNSKSGYESLKRWERTQNVTCKLVVSVGTYNAIGRFAGYSRYKGDQWVVSAVSFTGAENLKSVLAEFGVTDGVVMSQVVPNLDDDLPILKEARRKLKEDYGYVSLEGFLVGKMLIGALNNIQGEITREKFLSAINGERFNLGGVKLNFRGSNQGSKLVTMIYYKNGEYSTLDKNTWKKII
ncbi:branched-chain amino acid ABC transporter substrate-binding protein [Gammaproteobacteria bacterium 42_54_T18]|nr:branched-chain amino acid ABC transporter substrate-binding protein [Gammaproteobacteria bacterium 42_54_T18]